MPKYIIDSYAWIEYFKDSEKGRKAARILDSTENELFTPIVIIAEVCSLFQREGRDPLLAYEHIISLSTPLPFSAEFARDVGVLHGAIKLKIKDFGLVDAFVLFAAKKFGAKILTGDLHFKGFKEAVLI